MNIKKHAMKRWVQRVLNIKDKIEIDRYVTENEEMLKDNILKTFGYSSFIYKGQIGDNVTRNFYIQQDIIFVVNTTNDAIITVYMVDFGFPKHINLNVARELLLEVHGLIKEKEEADFEVLENIEAINNKIADLDTQIELTKKHLKSLEEQKKAHDEMKKAINKIITETDTKLQKTLHQLVNSIEYREDIKGGFN